MVIGDKNISHYKCYKQEVLTNLTVIILKIDHFYVLKGVRRNFYHIFLVRQDIIQNLSNLFIDATLICHLQ